MTDTANDFLLSGGAPSAKFETIGATTKGTVVSFRKEQQRDIKTNKPKFWDDGSPMEQLVVDLQTDERNAAITGDDGIRRLYVKSQLLKAVREAVRPHGGLAVGGALAVQYVGDGARTQVGFDPPKQYRAEYAPPVRKMAVDDIPSGGDINERLI